MFRWPWLRSPFAAIFVLTCLGITLYVLSPEFWGAGKTKDYPLWFWAGEQVLNGKNLYQTNASAVFNFIYPPLPAVLLAPPAYFGRIPLYVSICLVAAASWWIAAQLSNSMANPGQRPIPWWLVVLPSLVMLPAITDNFDLGQPNLFLLALMLLGFWLMQRGRPWSGGSLFALAAAIKAFPVAVFPYLVWRRQWRAAVSSALWLAVFLLLLPAPFRGFDRNLGEVQSWLSGMVGSYSEKGFGQRDEQNWSWRNQSLIAVTHRLIRPVSYNQADPGKPPAYVNLLDLDFKAANWVLLAISALIGLGFVAVMPSRAQITAMSDGEELGILFCLMTIVSPLARQYYFVWLFLPVTVLMQRAAFDPRSPARVGTWIALAFAGGLMTLSFPIFPKFLQAAGNNLAATFTLIGALAWHLLNPLSPRSLSDQRDSASVAEDCASAAPDVN